MWSPSLIFRKARTFRRLPAAERKLILSSFTLLAALRVALALLPFRRVLFMFGGRDLRQPVYSCTPRQVVRAVQLASRYMPGATCLTQAMTTQILLRRRGHSSCLHVGVAVRQKFEAHAWVEFEGEAAIGGGAKTDQFTTILVLRSRQS
jgi:hypothetical protein